MEEINNGKLFREFKIDYKGFENDIINKEQDINNFDNYDLILFHTSHSEFSKINFKEIDVPIFDATGTDYLSNSERI